LAREGREEELLQTVRLAEQAGVDYMPPLHEVMTSFYAHRGDLANLKKRVGTPTYGNWPTSTQNHTQGLKFPVRDRPPERVKFAVRNGQHEWAKSAFRDLSESRPRKALWDVILQWAVLCQDQGVEDVRRMMEVMVHKNSTERRVAADIETVNCLVQAAIDKQD